MSSRYPDDRRERTTYPSEYYSSSSRGGGGVIPISTQSFVNGVPVTTRSTYSEARQAFGTIPSDSPERRPIATSSSGRSRGTIVHNVGERPVSPVIRTSRYKYDTYVEPSSSGRLESRTAYSGEGTRGGRGGDDRDYGRKGYHLSGPASRTSGDDYDRHGRGDARTLYVDTEVRKPRRSSVDTGSGRRSSIDGFGIVVPPTGGRAGGPPPTTRGLDKINSGISRQSSLRDKPRSTHYRERGYSSYSDDDNESLMSARLMPTSHNPLFYERETMSPNHDDFDVEPRRPKYEDSDVTSRGFGIRGGSSVAAHLRDSGRDAVPHLDPNAGAVPYPRTSNNDLRSDYASEPSGYGARDEFRSEAPRNERRRDFDNRDRDVGSEKSRDYADRRSTRDNDYDYDDDASRYSSRKDRDKDRYEDDDRRSRTKRSEKDDSFERRERENQRDRDGRSQKHDDGIVPGVLTALAGGAAAFGAKEVLDRSKGKDIGDRDDREKRDKARDRERNRVERPDRDERDRRDRPRDVESDRERDPERIKKKETERERERERELARKEKERLGDLSSRNPQERPPPNREVDPEMQPPNRTVDLSSRNPRERAAQSLAPSDADRGMSDRRAPPIDEDAPRQRHYVTREDSFRGDVPETHAPLVPVALDPDEEYRRRVQSVQLDLEKSKTARLDDTINDSALSEEPRRRNHDVSPPEERPRVLDHDSRRLTDPVGAPPLINPAEARAMALLGDSGLTEEPSDIEGSSGSLNGERRVRIVEPSKDNTSPQPQIKGILRRPTDKFPEHPNHVREGALPLKEVADKKGVPAGARWTKIDRRLVNPDALLEAQERFEERSDCVIVLRVLTKEEIQKFADRTRELRDERYEQRHRRRDHDGAEDDDDVKEDGTKEKPRQIAFDA